MKNINPENLYFNEPRLNLEPLARLFVRLTTYSFYTILAAATATFLFSDINWLFLLGLFLSFYIIDRLLHINEAERSFNASGDNVLKEKTNSALYLSPSALSILEKSMDKSLLVGGDFYLHLLKFLIGQKDIREAFIRMEIPIAEFSEKLRDLLKESVNKGVKNSKGNLIKKIEEISKLSFGAAIANKEKFMEPRVVFSVLGFCDSENIKRLFSVFSIDSLDLEKSLIFGRFKQKFGILKALKILPLSLGWFANTNYKTRHRIMNRAWTARSTPTLDRYSADFTDLAREKKIGFLIGHEKEYELMVDVLSREIKNSALLVGDVGSGKETIISHLAFEIIKDKVPPRLFDKRLVSLQISNLMAGASPEEISSRVNKIIDEINRAGNIILYIPDIHNLVKSSGNNYLSAADMLIPVITGDAFPVIGSTYPREFKTMIEPQTDFSGAFEIIRVDEISEDDAVRLLTYQSVILERQYDLVISFSAVKTAVLLAHKYFHQKLLPSSAEELLKEALADATQKGNEVINADDIINIAERKINIPIHKAGKKEAEKLLNLEKIIHERLIDQEEAVSAVSRALREYRSGLSRKGGPIAVFLFVGPTGVGKTELAKILTKIQFGSENLMLRFDMSEYQDKSSIFRFIGSPDGKIAGSLTEAVIQKPYSLILLDEFEKAHSDILNLFLQVFDDGRLTDNFGRTVDFSNTIIIATSNAHSDFIKSHIEAHTSIESISEELKKKLTEYFRPELLNRFSKIIVFKPLSISNIESIVKINLFDLAENLKETQGIDLNFDEPAVKKIAELGYDPVFGARPLRGVISEKIRSVLAEKILKEEIIKGTNVGITVENNEIKIFQN